MKIFIFSALFFCTSVFATQDCQHASNTLEISQCKEQQTMLSNKQLKHYLAKAKETYRSDTRVSKAIIESQKVWKTYKKAQCDAVYQMYAQGTIVSIMTADCDYEMVKQRTHDIWRNFLQTLSGDPILPEPSQ